MRQLLLDRILDLKAILTAIDEDIQVNDLAEDDHVVESMVSFVTDEVIFLRSLLKKLETH